MISLLYVSTSRLSRFDRAREIGLLVANSRVKNAALCVTGALALVGDKFAQILEGQDDIVTDLMTRIKADTRHADVNVVALEEIAQRRFEKWSMAYVGHSTLIEGLIAPLVSRLQVADERRTAVHRLKFVMEGLASSGHSADCA